MVDRSSGVAFSLVLMLVVFQVLFVASAILWIPVGKGDELLFQGLCQTLKYLEVDLL